MITYRKLKNQTALLQSELAHYGAFNFQVIYNADGCRVILHPDNPQELRCMTDTVINIISRFAKKNHLSWFIRYTSDKGFIFVLYQSFKSAAL